MLIGQSVLAPSAAAAKYYSPWFPRQGNECTVVIEVLRASGALTTFTCQVYTKDQEDADPGTTVGSSITIGSSTTASTITPAVRSGFKELVRYEITLQGSGADRWVHFRSNPPIWEPN